MSAKLKISGRLKSMAKLDFRKVRLQVYAFVDGKKVASDKVDAKGNYSLSFRQAKAPAVTELKVALAGIKRLPLGANMLTQKVASMRFAKKGDSLIAVQDLMMPARYPELLLKITKTYELNGVVYAQYPTWFETLAGAKLEFYEVDRPFLWPMGTEPPTTESLLGYTYSKPDGSYEFEFSFSYNRFSHWISTDTTPDVRVKIYQFDDGHWQLVYTGEVDWNIEEDFRRDYLIPYEDIIAPAPGGVKPAEGFRYISLGLIPIDEAPVDPHFSKGYVTCYSGDPAHVVEVRHQPLCGRMRIFGLFADAPPVATYEAQLATADEDGPTGPWENITDALNNRKWDSTQSRWEHQVLGPDPVTGRYRNIDTEPEADWHEHALKITWNSRNKPDGYYAIRIIGYDTDDNAVVTEQMPVIRIDNQVPDVELKTTAAIGICDNTTLAPDRIIQFIVTAHDPDGHVSRYYLCGTRGNLDSPSNEAGDTIHESRDSGDLLWTGHKDELVEYRVDLRPAELATCDVLAYNFELHAYGLATNGYSDEPRSQHVKREVSLVVTE
jgi:hypothetical protein